ncbi:MAG: AAA family ATPase, partial [Bacteroidota bacterium]
NHTVTYVLKIDTSGNLEFTFKSNGKIKRMYPVPTHGWYSSAFGPFRRLGDKDTKEISSFSDGNLENHITLFDASYNLTSAIDWLKDLKFEQLNTPDRTNAFDAVIEFINHSELLPNNVKIEAVNHEGIFFIDGENKNIEIGALSDGYQSIFSIAIEILRQINKSFDLNKVLVKQNNKQVIIANGVIMIDEVDIHLHPQWQSKIGEWFKSYFPQMQFIVSTHSPIICQSADNGSIWKIEHFKTGKLSHQVEGQEFNRMVYGNIIDAIGTDNFGLDTIERSEKSKEMLNKMAKLNLKSIRGVATTEEKEELKKLKSILPSED